MPLGNYSLLVGRVLDHRPAPAAGTHGQILVSDDGELHRVSIGVRAAAAGLDYAVVERFAHPLTAALSALPPGLHRPERRPSGLALDYIRGNLVTPTALRPPPAAAGRDDDLAHRVDHYLRRAMTEEALVYAFGEAWGPEPRRDRHFGFTPGRGLRDLHMNQGSEERFAGSDGVWQDGGLLLRFGADAGEQWVAVLLRLRSQGWHTDGASGRRLEGDAAPHAGPVRIAAAMVNDPRSAGRASVTLLNLANRPWSLAGWRLADGAGQEQALEGELAAGALLQLETRPPLSLRADGGTITLLDAAGRKVDGVAYTAAQVRHPGWTIRF